MLGTADARTQLGLNVMARVSLLMAAAQLALCLGVPLLIEEPQQIAAPLLAPLEIDDALTPGADPSRALTALEGEMLSRTDSVAVVGHEPHLGYLLGALLTGHPRQSIPLKKGMLVGLQVEGATTILAGLRFSLSTKAAAQLT